jgi:hypothetical protein
MNSNLWIGIHLNKAGRRVFAAGGAQAKRGRGAVGIAVPF